MRLKSRSGVLVTGHPFSITSSSQCSSRVNPLVNDPSDYRFCAVTKYAGILAPETASGMAEGVALFRSRGVGNRNRSALLRSSSNNEGALGTLVLFE